MCGDGQIWYEYSVSYQRCMGEESGKGGKGGRVDGRYGYSNCFYNHIFSDNQPQTHLLWL